jgi:hypothetical protein
MSLRPQYSLLNSEFNDFLFARLGEEKTGIELTVLSALTRLGFDPWGEAARLAGLPPHAAARALAKTIALLPEGDWNDWNASDPAVIAARLVHRLPGRAAPSLQGPRTGRPKDARRKSLATASLICVALGIGALLVIWHLRSDHVSEPPAKTISSTQR